MPNLQQAPAIKNNGEKFIDNKKWGKAIRTHELETAIMCGLGDRDMAQLKIMLFLTGNAEGFQVAEKTIMSRCNISESGYKNARKKLIEKGWISLTPGKEITVNYKNIYNSGKGFTENTPLENEKIKGYSENTSQGYTENTSQGQSENTHNNIRNNIKEYDKMGIDVSVPLRSTENVNSLVVQEINGIKAQVMTGQEALVKFGLGACANKIAAGLPGCFWISGELVHLTK